MWITFLDQGNNGISCRIQTHARYSGIHHIRKPRCHIIVSLEDIHGYVVYVVIIGYSFKWIYAFNHSLFKEPFLEMLRRASVQLLTFKDGTR